MRRSLNYHIRFQLAAGVRRPASPEERAYRERWFKPGALPGTGFPGLTPEDIARIKLDSEQDPPIPAGPRPRPTRNPKLGGSALAPSAPGRRPGARAATR
jgi:hypothetical protein